MDDEPISGPLVAYRLGAVRVGIQATVLALFVLIVFRLLPGHGPIPTVPYVGILVLAAIGGVGVRLLPWERLFASGLGMRVLYIWSILDILLITVAIAITGGSGSEVFILYALTTVFFGAAYPPRSQVALLGFTFACYLTVLGVTGWHVALGIVFLRCGVLAIVALIVSFLAAELLRHIESLQGARVKAERSAALLSTVAGSARRMTLDRNPAMESIVDSVMDLGFDGAALCGFDHESVTFLTPYHRGLSQEYVSTPHAATEDMPGLVRLNGETQIVDPDHPIPDGVDMPLMDEGFAALIASPVWVDGWLAGVLVGGIRDPRPISLQEAEAFQLLSAQAGLALENAQRFEETLHTVEQLEELDRLKDDFLATASHEIRTPLTVILGSGLTLEQRWEDIGDEIRRELLAGLNRNARALDRLLSSLLDFARLGADSLNLTKEPCAVGRQLRGVAERLRPLFLDHPLDLIAEEGLEAEADALLLDRVLENLLSNAAKHTPKGTHVVASARAEDGAVEVAIVDDGPGLSEDDARHLGERFFRAGDRNDRSTKGLGLGLALVREILELHGTELEVETRPGHGSRFAFLLPRVATDEEGALQGPILGQASTTKTR